MGTPKRKTENGEKDQKKKGVTMTENRERGGGEKGWGKRTRLKQEKLSKKQKKKGGRTLEKVSVRRIRKDIDRVHRREEKSRNSDGSRKVGTSMEHEAEKVGYRGARGEKTT